MDNLIEKYITDNFIIVKHVYLEDAQFEDGTDVDGRYSYVLVPKQLLKGKNNGEDSRTIEAAI